MSGLNAVQLVGTIYGEPKGDVTQSGTAFLKFSVLCVSSYTYRGETREQRDAVPCILWGKRAEEAAPMLKEGNWVTVQGRVSAREWEGRDGGKRVSVEIGATDVKPWDQAGTAAPTEAPAEPPAEPFPGEE